MKCWGFWEGKLIFPTKRVGISVAQLSPAELEAGGTRSNCTEEDSADTWNGM